MSSGPDHLAARRETIYDAFARARARTGSFDPSRSPLHRRVAFVVGAPRSGTTWLQQMLFTHPLVATGGESHLFCEVLPAAFENFSLPDQTANLGSWVSKAELLSAARAFCDSVFLAQREGTRADAQVILEKTPNHRMQSALQAALYPDARYVHIIRDGRDATASQRVNWSGLTKEFADAGAMARAWAAEVRDIRQHFGGLDYLELRYEDVVADPSGSLALIFDHLGLPHDRALREAAAEFGRAPVNTYLGSFSVGVRKHQGDTLAERSVALAAGDLLTELGYADADEVARLQRLRTPATIALDVRDAFVRAMARTRERWATTLTRMRRRGRRRITAPGKALSAKVVGAIEADDAEQLAKLLAPRATVDGTLVDDPSAAAKDLLARLRGSHPAHRSVFGAQAQITFVSKDGQRRVMRIRSQGDLAGEIELG